MATYKLSLFALFLIVLGALIISMLVGNWFHTKEGMISFYNGTSPLSTVVHIANYSGPTTTKFGKNVVLIYDNIFFDQDNANIIEVDSTAINGNVMIGNVMTGNAETNGSSIQNIYITNAIGSDDNFNPDSVKTYSYKENTLQNIKATEESQRGFEKNFYTEMIYTTKSKNTNEYTVFVLPWNNSNYIHIIDNKNKTNVNTTWFGPKNSHSIHSYNEIKNTLPFDDNGLYARNLKENPMLNTFMIQESYNSQSLVYQLSDCIFFNNNTGVLIIYKDKKYQDFTAYNQAGETISNNSIQSQKRSEKAFSAWHKYNKFGNIMVLYINNGKDIMIALIQPTGYENNTTIYTLFNVQRFNNIGLESGPSYGREGASKFVGLNSGGSDSVGGLNGFGLGVTNGWGQGGPGAWGGPGGPGTWSGGAGPGAGAPTGMMNDYYRWFYHWATNGLNNNPNGPNFNYSDDYIMKTQIVPPVCPSCPSCPSTGTCTNCGGNGGSGTQTKDGTSLTEGGYENRNLNITGDGLTISDAANTVGGVLNNAIVQPANIAAGLENTIEKGASGAVNLARDTGSGAVNLAKDTGSGAVNLAKDTASGALNQINMMGSTAIGLGKDIVGGTIDLGKDIVGGISDLGDRQRENQNQNQNQNQDQGVGSNQYGYANSYGGGSAANQLLPKNTASNVDQSNLYGAVPNKGNSNYMPLGSDFSKFGR